eukprot:498893_1
MRAMRHNNILHGKNTYVCQKYNYKFHNKNTFCNGGRIHFVKNHYSITSKRHHFKSKLGLHRILTPYCNKYHTMDNVCNFKLLSYDMNNIHDRIEFLNQHINCTNVTKSKTWVFKESNKHMGNGIHPINNPQLIYQLIAPNYKGEYKMNDKLNTNCKNINMNKTDINYINYINYIKQEGFMHNKNKIIYKKELIIQEFVANPLLIEQKRFHLRSYFIIPSCQNPLIVLHYSDLVHIVVNPSIYNKEKDATNKYSIITNQHFHRSSKEITQSGGDDLMDTHQFQKYLSEVYQNKNNYTKIKLDNDLIHILKTILTANSYYNKINKVPTDFEYTFHDNIDSKFDFGCMDILINDQFQLKLLEINYGCGLWEIGNNIDGQNLINETIDVVLELYQKRINNVTIQSIDSLNHFKIAFWEN